jgi:peptide methionine sulfoxide reductase msrA/msrB
MKDMDDHGQLDGATGEDNVRYECFRKLTPDEERVIVNHGTEMPFIGKYCEHFEPGLYVCRRCGAPLFRSDDKFRSHCGWPSFDDELPGAITRSSDPDGIRTEVSCNFCSGHLGHVFNGEGYTRKDVRFCVNSISLDFEPASMPGFRRAIFAGGCFWGVEYYLQQAPGVLYTTVGYTGGDKKFPGYEEVCTHSTGHAEAVEVIFDSRETDFTQLTRLFLEIHDPTQANRQGPDVGSQYRSAIFCYNKEQFQIAASLLDELRRNGVSAVTTVCPASRFWPAEEYHRNYYRRQKKLPYCHRRVTRFPAA